jgi:hypothetical protein
MSRADGAAGAGQRRHRHRERLELRHRRVSEAAALPARAAADADGRLTLRVDLGPAHTEEQFSGPGQPTFVTRIVTFNPAGSARTTHAERPWIQLPRLRSCRTHPGYVVARVVQRRATGERLVSVSAIVRGKQVARTHKAPARLAVHGLGRGRARVGALGVTSAGRHVAARRIYARCRAAAPRARHDSD